MGCCHTPTAIAHNTLHAGQSRTEPTPLQHQGLVLIPAGKMLLLPADYKLSLAEAASRINIYLLKMPSGMMFVVRRA